MAERLKFAVTLDQAEAARARLAAAGFPLAGDAGVLEKDGYRIGYALANNTLLLEVQAKPRLVPMLAVKARIRSMLAGEGIAEVA